MGTDKSGQGGTDFKRESGDHSCFLFNLSQNMRFNAVRDRGPY